MRKALVLVFLLVPAFVLAQDYIMYETHYLKVSPGHSKEFNEAMKSHNDRFHADGPYAASVWYVPNGPRSGQIFWAMGPCTFTDFDNRPSDEAHNGDWTNNVLAHAEQGETEYWRMDPELSYQPDTFLRDKLRVRIIDIKRFEDYRFNELQRKAKQVLVAKQYKNPSTVWRTASWSGTGRDWAIAMSFDKWAEVDGGDSFPADYEEVHGEGSWRLFLEEIEEVVLHAEEEFHTFLPELSAPRPAASDQ